MSTASLDCRYRGLIWHQCKRKYIFAQSWCLVWLSATPCSVACKDPFLHGIFQATILGWVAIPSSGGSSQSRNWACVSCISCIGRRIFYQWANRKTAKGCRRYWKSEDNIKSMMTMWQSENTGVHRVILKIQ